MIRFATLPALAGLTLAVAFADGPKLEPKTFTEKIPNSEVKFEMVYVPGGEFEMGSPDGEPGRLANEGPKHKVKVGAFWIGKCEVSWDEFDLWWKNENLQAPLKDPPYAPGGKPDAITKPTNPYVDETYDHGREGFPAICMSHHAAMMYCHWLRAETKKGYRLPTEAEWEFAARAGTTTAYSFGADASKLSEYARFKGNAKDDDHPKGTTGKVGTLKPNAFGLYDIHGNVAEWVLDAYDADYFGVCAKSPLTLDPVVLPKDRKWGHVARGGSFKDEPELLRSAARRVSDKTWMKEDPQLPQSIWWLTKKDQIGFRICLPAAELAALKDLKPMVEKKADND